MKQSWTCAALGGCVGAAFTLVVAVGARALGISPFAVADGQALHAYLVTHPGILVEMTNKLEAQQDADQDSARQSAVNRLGLKAFFNPDFAFVTGPADARTTIVEFFDYNCPYCRASAPAMKKFYESHARARFSFIEFPIKGPSSTVAARAAMAARRQPDKYVSFHFALMNQQGAVDENSVYAVAQKSGLDVAKLKADMSSPAIDRALAAAHALAAAVNIDGTPAFVIDGKIREGAVSDEILAQMTR